MALSSVWHGGLARAMLCAGFESGHVALWDGGRQGPEGGLLALARLHEEPILAAELSPGGTYVGISRQARHGSRFLENFFQPT